MGRCLESNVVISSGALEKICNDSDWILENEEEFWEEEKSHKLARAVNLKLAEFELQNACL